MLNTYGDVFMNEAHQSEHHQAQAWEALVKMANEIASNVAPGQTQEQAAKAMANHIVRFWAKAMRTQLIDCLEMENNQLQPTALQGIELLKEMQH